MDSEIPLLAKGDYDKMKEEVARDLFYYIEEQEIWLCCEHDHITILRNQIPLIIEGLQRFYDENVPLKDEQELIHSCYKVREPKPTVEHTPQSQIDRPEQFQPTTKTSSL